MSGEGRAVLRRDLGLTDIVSLGINGVIGTGIFFLPGEAAALLGPAATFAFLASAVLCSFLVLCFAEAGSRFRGTGGPILYAEAAFGRFVGFEVGWMALITRIITWAALANAMVTALGALVAGVATYRSWIICGLFLGIAIVNATGVRSSARVTNFFTLAKLLPMIVFVAVGVFHFDIRLARPFAPHGYGDLGAGTLLILFAFVGFEVLSIPAGEMKDPERNVPTALFTSMTVITVIYLSIWAVCVGTLPTLSGSASPVSDAAAVFMGPFGTLLVSVGILMSVVGVNLAVSITASRCLYALSSDRYLPRILGHVHPTTGAPVIAILLTSALGLAVALSGTYVELAVLAVIARFAQFVPTCLAVLVLRRRRPGGARFQIRGGPVVPVLALALCGWLLLEAEPGQLFAGALAMALGAVVYLASQRLRREPASQDRDRVLGRAPNRRP